MKNLVMGIFAVLLMAASISLFNASHAIDTSDLINGGKNITSTTGSKEADKALGILDVVKTMWFKILSAIGGLIISVAGFALRRKNPDSWEKYFNILIALGLAILGPTIWFIIVDVVEKYATK